MSNVTPEQYIEERRRLAAEKADLEARLALSHLPIFDPFEIIDKIGALRVEIVILETALAKQEAHLANDRAA